MRFRWNRGSGGNAAFRRTGESAAPGWNSNISAGEMIAIGRAVFDASCAVAIVVLQCSVCCHSNSNFGSAGSGGRGQSVAAGETGGTLSVTPKPLQALVDSHKRGYPNPAVDDSEHWWGR
ncbi:MAG: hypothetical protein ABI627_02105 [Polyangiaceae bacterium]